MQSNELLDDDLLDKPRRRLKRRTKDEWGEIIMELLREPPYLHPEELEFLQSMASWTLHKCPTAKQGAWVRKIERRFGNTRRGRSRR